MINGDRLLLFANESFYYCASRVLLHVRAPVYVRPPTATRACPPHTRVACARWLPCRLPTSHDASSSSRALARHVRSTRWPGRWTRSVCSPAPSSSTGQLASYLHVNDGCKSTRPSMARCSAQRLMSVHDKEPRSLASTLTALSRRHARSPEPRTLSPASPRSPTRSRVLVGVAALTRPCPLARATFACQTPRSLASSPVFLCCLSPAFGVGRNE